MDHITQYRYLKKATDLLLSYHDPEAINANELLKNLTSENAYEIYRETMRLVMEENRKQSILFAGQCYTSGKILSIIVLILFIVRRRFSLNSEYLWALTFFTGFLFAMGLMSQYDIHF